MERLMTITMLLLNRKRVQAQELADHLEVSLRTIYRDLDTLSQSGIPIVSYPGNDGGYEIMENFRLDRQMLSLNELHALYTALQGLNTTKAMKQQTIDRLLDKVGALVSRTELEQRTDSDQIAIDLTPWKSGEAARALYESLHSAVQEKKLVDFTYTDSKGAESERCIEPHMLVLKGYTWYLHGYCLNRDDYRLFRLSRIRDLMILSKTFRRRSLTITEVNEQWGNLWHQHSVDLVLHFKGSTVVTAMDHFESVDTEKQADGSMLVRTCYHYTNEDSLIGFLLSFHSNVTIIEPLHIASAVRQRALDVFNLYKN
nr:YafY family protein [Paenibacillus sp. GSMTC-2017]